jgi:glyceraldehyde-3-phosphate dehydrogenase/erythrose-4-phosphate dehydrogenase
VVGVKHKLGIIGFGGMGRAHFDHLTKNFPRLEVKGIFDISPKACEAARERGAYVYGGIDAYKLTAISGITVVGADSHFVYASAKNLYRQNDAEIKIDNYT